MATVRINHFQAAEGQAAALQDFLRRVIDMVRKAQGCQECRLLVDPEQPTRLVIVETWDSIATHQAAAKVIPPEMLVSVRPLLAQPPSGTYYDRLL